MPVILKPEDHDRLLRAIAAVLRHDDPDPHELLRSFPGGADAHVAYLHARELSRRTMTPSSATSSCARSDRGCPCASRLLPSRPIRAACSNMIGPSAPSMCSENRRP